MRENGVLQHSNIAILQSIVTHVSIKETYSGATKYLDTLGINYQRRRHLFEMRISQAQL